ncbi:hypothetical protein J2S74_000498 [Evansella vedderi]|uniref:Uncharacterized protein n=1 Tax=Evansella vedderi TaxID=38282 RepID=A0ABT9ZPF5_9BACI|nr:hypothetical protein [Evansella vedderi]MDQ0253126.1 hypothetical protein [Evansella vedderi]
MKSAGNGSARRAVAPAVTRRKKDSYETPTPYYLCKDCGGFAHCFGGTKDKVRSFVAPIFTVGPFEMMRIFINVHY